MSITSRLYRWRRIGPLAIGACAMLGLVVAFTPDAPAQTKKADKEEPEIKTEAKFKDIMVGTVGGVEQVRFIDEQIEKAWKENKVAPSNRCTDYEFIRRATLDLIGRIATPEEISAFFKDAPDRRRSLLIEKLLKNAEFGENFGNLWTVMLLTRTGSQKVHQEQMREWLTEQFNSPSKNGWSDTAAELISAEGVTNEKPQVNFVLHHLGEPIPQGEGEKSGKFDMVPVTSRTTKLFLGLRTQCVQCHDHPFNSDWQQQHFWGINAFYRATDAPRGRPQGMNQNQKKKGTMEGQRELKDDPRLNVKGMVSYERRNAVVYVTNSTFLTGKKLKLTDPDSSRRKELAKFITNDPHFSKVFVNRMWHHFFGKSFTKDAPDDFGEHNPVSHPELLEKLSEDWAKKYNHNPKDLVRWICNSRAYGLSSVAHKGNDKVEDEIFFARMLLKPMTPEQLFDSLRTATEARVRKELNDKEKEAREDAREKWLKQLVENFGNDEGEEGTFNGTVVQALMLMNGKEMNDAVMDKDVGTVSIAMKERGVSPRKALDRLYLAALNRPATDKEAAKILNDATFRALPRVPGAAAQPAFWTAYYQDIFWALLNSNEFILNH